MCDGKSTVGIEKLEPVRTGPHAIRIHVLYIVLSRGDGLMSSVSGEEDLCVIIVHVIVAESNHESNSQE